jgi:hypothetical protein
VTPPFPSETHGRPRTPWAVFCVGPTSRWDDAERHGLIYLTEQEYEAQLDDSDMVWVCPLCGSEANWNDENYEEMTQ